MRPLLFFLLLLSPLCAQSQADYDREIKGCEGFSWQPYRDGQTGKYAVGWGHSISRAEVPRHRNLSFDRLTQLYQADFSRAYAAALTQIPNWDEQPSEVRVLLVSLAYNTGATGFSRFARFKQAIIQRDYLAAARELRESKWARQVGENRVADSQKVLTRAAFRLR
jgi:lysozyme